MKKILFFALFLLFVSVYSQNSIKDTVMVKTEKRTTINFFSGLGNSSIVLNTKLGGNWSLQNELLFSRVGNSQFLEIPLLLKYNITNKWSVFFGSKLDYSINNEFGIGNNTSPSFGVSAQIGTRYDFNTGFFGELKFNHSFTKEMINPSLGFKSSDQPEFKLKLGAQF